jgi:hypothetical protein
MGDVQGMRGLLLPVFAVAKEVLGITNGQQGDGRWQALLPPPAPASASSCVLRGMLTPFCAKMVCTHPIYVLTLAGTANTSLLYHAKELYALHERDLPYQVGKARLLNEIPFFLYCFGPLQKAWGQQRKPLFLAQGSGINHAPCDEAMGL